MGADGAGTPRLQYRFTWRIMYLYQNWDDGIADNTYSKTENMFLRIVLWSALRNPVNGLRIVPYLSCKIEADKIRFKGSFGDYLYFMPRFAGAADVAPFWVNYDTKIPQWFLCWQGLYGCFYWQFMVGESLYRFWIGHKLYPTDIYGGPYGYRARGAGFGSQFKRVK